MSMSVNIRLAKPEDQRRCSELHNVLATATSEVTSDSYEVFDSETFGKLISNEKCISYSERKYTSLAASFYN